ncbi:MAG: TatD family hydrolase [Verrucomicrobiota bacterium]
MFTDTHAHLDFSDFDVDRADVIHRAETNGVKRIITIGTDMQASIQAVTIADAYSHVYAVIGIHPNEAMEAHPDFISLLKNLAQHPKVVAIGECGLDYHHLPSKEKPVPFQDLAGINLMGNPDAIEDQMADDEVKNKQAIVFQQQLDLAVELGFNVIVHQRDSWDDTLKMLEPYHGKLRAVFHCFGGDLNDANFLIERGHRVSFTGIVTFKNAKQVQHTAKNVPDGSFMLETDCPFLAPTPYRGQRCEPSYTRLIAEKIAELRHTTSQEISRVTEETVNSFFRFSRA